MADFPAHKLGQIIGDELEAATRQSLQEIAGEFTLCLDYKHARSARDGRKKVAWKDSYGNVHDLDYVLEEGGSEDMIGQPRAFVEIAWRRYTKHSRKKAQEIQGAILPLAETYRQHSPFLGAMLAGDFTEASLDQLRSHKFHLAYVAYEEVVRAFKEMGVDVSSDENAGMAESRRKVKTYNR